MINEPVIEVTCDKCKDNIEITPEYVYFDYSGKSGMYATNDSDIEKQLTNADGWICSDGKQYLFARMCRNRGRRRLM